MPCWQRLCSVSGDWDSVVLFSEIVLSVAVTTVSDTGTFFKADFSVGRSRVDYRSGIGYCDLLF